MWNPLGWFRRRSSRTLDIPSTDNGDDAHREREDAEMHLRREAQRDAEINRLVRRTPGARRDQFGEDLKRAFGV